MRVRVRADLEVPFRRSVRDRDGRVIERLVFPPGKIVDLNARQAAAVKDDLGKALVELEADARGKLRTKAEQAKEPGKPTPQQPAPKAVPPELALTES